MGSGQSLATVIGTCFAKESFPKFSCIPHQAPTGKGIENLVVYEDVIAINRN